MKYRWKYFDYDKELQRNLSYSLSLNPVTATLILNRNIKDKNEAEEFLRPSINKLSDPFLLPDMEKAVKRINDALTKKEKILIYGDYDVDGITATALLVNFFKLFDINAEFYIPHRVNEGYSLSISALDEIYNKYKPDLLITVDCGTSDYKEIEHATKYGIDVIVTDHHSPPDGPLPNCIALVNPKLSNAPNTFKLYSGVGVAFNIAWAIFKSLSKNTKLSPPYSGFLASSISLVTLGTVADIVPLIGQNRILVNYGLKAIINSSNPGIRNLLEYSKIPTKDYLKTHIISYRIAPRLNAEGRINDGNKVVNIFTSSDENQIKSILNELEISNRKRKTIEDKIFKAAQKQIKDNPQIHNNSYVTFVYDKDWHAGVIGIVASRLVNKYGKPAIVGCIKDNNTLKCSARSIPEFHIQNSLSQLSELLSNFGGHSQAAGLEMSMNNVDKFREDINSLAEQQLKGIPLMPLLNIEIEIPFHIIDYDLYKELQLLEPYGRENPQPIFSTSNVIIKEKPKMIKTSSLSFPGGQEGKNFLLVGWNMAEYYERILSHINKPIDIAYTINYSTYSNQIELYIKDINFK